MEDLAPTQETSDPACATADCAPSAIFCPHLLHERSLRTAAEQLNNLLQDENKQLVNRLLQEQSVRMEVENELIGSASQAKYDQRMHEEYSFKCNDLQRNLEVMQEKVMQLELELQETTQRQSVADILMDLKISESKASDLKARLSETENELNFYKFQTEELKKVIMDLNREKEETISFEDHLKMMKASEDLLKQSQYVFNPPEQATISSSLTSQPPFATSAINTPDLPAISQLLQPASQLQSCSKHYVTPNDVQPLSPGEWSSDEDMDEQETPAMGSGQATSDPKPRIAPKPKHLLKEKTSVKTQECLVEDIRRMLTTHGSLTDGSLTDDTMEEEAVSFSQNVHPPPLKTPSRSKGPKRRRKSKRTLLRKAHLT